MRERERETEMRTHNTTYVVPELRERGMERKKEITHVCERERKRERKRGRTRRMRF